MTNQTNTSQTRKLNNLRLARLKRAVQAGKLKAVVEGHPFQALLELPVEEVVQWFQAAPAAAFLVGLQGLLNREQDRLLYKVAGSDELWEARGLAKAYDHLLSLPEEIETLAIAVRESQKQKEQPK